MVDIVDLVKRMQVDTRCRGRAAVKSWESPQNKPTNLPHPWLHFSLVSYFSAGRYGLPAVNVDLDFLCPVLVLQGTGPPAPSWFSESKF